MPQLELVKPGRTDEGRAVDRALAAIFGIALGFSTAAAAALAILLAGGGALLLGPQLGPRVCAIAFLPLAVALSIVFAKSLDPLLRSSDRSPPGDIPRWLWWLLAAALVVFLTSTLLQDVRAPDGAWDAWSIWNARARTLLRTAGDVRLACAPERGIALFTLHPDYPLLLPAAIAISWRALGSESAWVPAIFSLLPSLLTVAIAALVVARSSPRRGIWLATLLLTVPELSIMASARYAEAALGTLLIAGLGLLLLAFGAGDRSRNGLLFAAGVALGLSLSIKHEGALFLAAALIVTLLSSPRDALPLLLGAAAPVLLFCWFALGFAPPGDLSTGGIPQLVHRAAGGPRISEILLAFLRRLAFFQAWGLHLAALAIALGVRLLRRDLKPPARTLLAICGLVLLGFFFAYLTTPHELAWHLRTSIDRLILQLVPAALLAICM